jgi:hypothetical protein
MLHELLWNVLDAQHANATLTGPVLRAAADDLLCSRPNQRTLFMAFDAAGERILGAAMAVADESLEVFDYTRPFPDRATCVLVGGFIAGPAGIASAAAAVTSAGAERVEAVLVGGPTARIAGVNRIRLVGRARAHVA